MLMLCLLLLWLGAMNQGAQSLKPFVCPSEWGVFPHPENHTRFFRCVGGRPILNECSSGVFLPARRICLQIQDNGNTALETLSDTSKTTSLSDDSPSSSLLSKAMTASPADRTQTDPSGLDTPSLMTAAMNVSRRFQKSSSISTNAHTAATAIFEPRNLAERKFGKRADINEDMSEISPRNSSVTDKEQYDAYEDESNTSKTSFVTDKEQSDNHEDKSGTFKTSSVTNKEQSIKRGNEGPTTNPIPQTDSSTRLEQKTETEPSLLKTVAEESRISNTQDSVQDPEKYGENTASKDEEGLTTSPKTYSQEATVDEDSFLCPQESGFFPHQTNCTRFFWCVQWKPSAMVCPPAEWFDPHKRICFEIQDTDDCGDGKTTPGNINRRLKDAEGYDVDNNVKQVVQVSRNKRSVLSGSGRQAVTLGRDDVISFSDVSSSSDSRRSGRHVRQADDTNQPGTEEPQEDSGPQADNSPPFEDEPSTPSTGDVGDARTVPLFRCPGDGFHADPDDCTYFYHCFSGDAFQHRCQPGTAFHQDKLVCGWPQAGQECAGAVTSEAYTAKLPNNSPASGNGNRPSDNFQYNFRCPDEMSGFYPHPEDCTVFFQCDSGKAFRHQCGKGTAFNQEQGVCSWPLKLETGCGAILEKTPNRRLSRHEVKDSAYKAKHVQVRSNNDPILDDKPVVQKKETFDNHMLKQVYPETTHETVSEIPTKLVSKTVSLLSAPTTHFSFLFKNPQTNPVTAKENEHPPIADDDPVKHQNVNTDMSSEHLPITDDDSVKNKTLNNEKSNENLPIAEDGPVKHQNLNTDKNNEDSPTTDDDSVKHKNLNTDKNNEDSPIIDDNPSQHQTTDKSNEERLQTGSAKLRNSTSIFSGLEAETRKLGTDAQTTTGRLEADSKTTTGQLKGDTETTTGPTVGRTAETSTKRATVQQSLNDGDMSKLKMGKMRSVKLRTIAWPWETSTQKEVKIEEVKTKELKTKELKTKEVKTKELKTKELKTEEVKTKELKTEEVKTKELKTNELKTSTESGLTSTETTNQVDTTTKPTPFLTALSSAIKWYWLFTKKMPLVSSSSPGTTRDGTKNGETPTAPPAKTSPAEISSRSPGSPRKVRAEVYRVLGGDTDFRCPFPTGHFRDALNCSVYYRCINGQAYRNDCPGGELYHTQRHKCLEASQVTDCWTGRRSTAVVNSQKQQMDDVFSDRGKDEDVTSFRCPKSHGLYRDPQDCRIFYRCFAGRAFRHECGVGTLFSRQHGFCRRSALVTDCPEASQQSQEVTSLDVSTSQMSAQTAQTNPPRASALVKTCRHQDDGAVPSLTSYNSRSDVMKVVNEREGGEGRWPSGAVNFVAEVDEDGSNPVSHVHVAAAKIFDDAATEFTCPFNVFNQYFPDPDSCWRFHRCFKGRRFSFICPPGTFYDAENKLCDFQKKVLDCDPQGRRISVDYWTSSESNENEVFPWLVKNDNDQDWEDMSESSQEQYPRPVTEHNNDNSREHTPGTSPRGYPRPVTERDHDNSGEHTSESSPNNIPNTLCPRSDGLFPHPSSCRKFVYCSRGAPVVLTCPKDLLYNTDTKTCDYRDSIVCLRYDR